MNEIYIILAKELRTLLESLDNSKEGNLVYTFLIQLINNLTEKFKENDFTFDEAQFLSLVFHIK